jgi:hypothetical protein
MSGLRQQWKYDIRQNTARDISIHSKLNDERTLHASVPGDDGKRAASLVLLHDSVIQL